MTVEHSVLDRRTFMRHGVTTLGALLTLDLDALTVRAQDPQQKAHQDDLPVLKKNRITFELAKKLDEAGRKKYLDQVLCEEWKLVHDPKRNPDGYISWFYWPDVKQRKEAIKNIEDYLRSEGDTTDVKEHTKLHDKALTAMPYCKNAPSLKQRAGFLLIGKDVFDLTNENEFFSTLDYVSSFMHAYENGMDINGRELTFKNASVSHFSDALIRLHARMMQLTRIFTGKRGVVSESLINAAKADYNDAYGTCKIRLPKVKETAEKVTIKDYKEGAAMLEEYLSSLDTKMKTLGYAHKPVDGKENTYELVKLKK